MERDVWENWSHVAQFLFQLTRSRGAWPVKIDACTNYFTFQLTRSRGAWRSGKCWGHRTFAISTHTLTWSVTHSHPIATFIQKISTHTLTWSVTTFTILYFLKWKISTHTLTWSVTLYKKEFKVKVVFQLTRSRGAWLSIYNQLQNGGLISTHTLTWSVT